MLVDRVGESLERILKNRFGFPTAESAENLRVLQEPVNSRREDRSLAPEQWGELARLPRDAPVSDLVAGGQHPTELREGPGHRGETDGGWSCHLDRIERGPQREDPESMGGALDRGVIDDVGAEHHAAAADPDDGSLVSGPCDEGLVERSVAQPAQVGADVLRPREDNKVATLEISRTEDPSDLGGMTEHVELVEVRGKRVAHNPHHRSASPVTCPGRGALLVRELVSEHGQVSTELHARHIAHH